ncbi:molybdenum cofactor guanylyltransferase MobA [Thermococcus sp. GR7]|uniref:molybdenum cofactor guanylyltransferase MobA n=1 Tax=unclassified Thermococcus TaxID=2627626 RepID=UPI001431569A|nr:MULTISPECIES: molybdenum cofactor guanylyltransferase MobA [unclassified Thermococcus]NJE46203.1 molybdenum cofactor guanylyltransferase MobA [Thermococcus sp. GR7]NJE79388.1 molybdenum cofactor guanylyltransferase MobA [Thermococcus sp. GR4]NJF23998.1 molybdenum cofactor guanylyltransferase MobA [Thermococcus sp. GR5]
MIGAVLAGGRSKRFGGNKLLYRIDGKPLILHTIERLESANEIEEVVIVASPENAEKLKTFGYQVLVDELLVGPIGGIYTALSLGDAFVTAGDMPRIVPEFVDYIIKYFHKSRKAVCVPRWINGHIEPLHAAYSMGFLDIIEGQLALEEYKIKRAIEKANVCYLTIEKVPPEWRESFFNVNRKDDLRKLGISEPLV